MEPPAKDVETQPSTTTKEQELAQGSHRPRRRRWNQKDGRGLVKDTTAPTEKIATMEHTTTLELIREPQPIITAQSQRGKGVLTAESEVLRYPDSMDTTHEFGTLLQFGTTYELMEFLATHQIKVSQRMAEEHAEQQMIKRPLTGTTESEDEGPLAKVGR